MPAAFSSLAPDLAAPPALWQAVQQAQQLQDGGASTVRSGFITGTGAFVEV